MEKEEFVKAMKRLGYTDAEIDESIAMHDEAAKEGISMPYELDLIERPTPYP